MATAKIPQYLQRKIADRLDNLSAADDLKQQLQNQAPTWWETTVSAWQHAKEKKQAFLPQLALWHKARNSIGFDKTLRQLRQEEIEFFDGFSITDVPHRNAEISIPTLAPTTQGQLAQAANAQPAQVQVIEVKSAQPTEASPAAISCNGTDKAENFQVQTWRALLRLKISFSIIDTLALDNRNKNFDKAKWKTHYDYLMTKAKAAQGILGIKNVKDLVNALESAQYTNLNKLAYKTDAEQQQDVIKFMHLVAALSAETLGETEVQEHIQPILTKGLFALENNERNVFTLTKTLITASYNQAHDSCKKKLYSLAISILQDQLNENEKLEINKHKAKEEWPHLANIVSLSLQQFRHDKFDLNIYANYAHPTHEIATTIKPKSHATKSLHATKSWNEAIATLSNAYHATHFKWINPAAEELLKNIDTIMNWALKKEVLELPGGITAVAHAYTKLPKNYSHRKLIEEKLEGCFNKHQNDIPLEVKKNLAIILLKQNPNEIRKIKLLHAVLASMHNDVMNENIPLWDNPPHLSQILLKFNELIKNNNSGFKSLFRPNTLSYQFSTEQLINPLIGRELFHATQQIEKSRCKDALQSKIAINQDPKIIINTIKQNPNLRRTYTTFVRDFSNEFIANSALASGNVRAAEYKSQAIGSAIQAASIAIPIPVVAGLVEITGQAVGAAGSQHVSNKAHAQHHVVIDYTQASNLSRYIAVFAAKIMAHAYEDLTMESAELLQKELKKHLLAAVVEVSKHKENLSMKALATRCVEHAMNNMIRENHSALEKVFSFQATTVSKYISLFKNEINSTLLQFSKNKTPAHIDDKTTALDILNERKLAKTFISEAAYSSEFYAKLSRAMNEKLLGNFLLQSGRVLANKKSTQNIANILQAGSSIIPLIGGVLRVGSQVIGSGGELAAWKEALTTKDTVSDLKQLSTLIRTLSTALTVILEDHISQCKEKSLTLLIKQLKNHLLKTMVETDKKHKQLSPKLAGIYYLRKAINDHISKDNTKLKLNNGETKTIAELFKNENIIKLLTDYECMIKDKKYNKLLKSGYTEASTRMSQLLIDKNKFKNLINCNTTLNNFYRSINTQLHNFLIADFLVASNKVRPIAFKSKYFGELSKGTGGILSFLGACLVAAGEALPFIGKAVKITGDVAQTAGEYQAYADSVANRALTTDAKQLSQLTRTVSRLMATLLEPHIHNLTDQSIEKLQQQLVTHTLNCMTGHNAEMDSLSIELAALKFVRKALETAILEDDTKLNKRDDSSTTIAELLACAKNEMEDALCDFEELNCAPDKKLAATYTASSPRMFKGAVAKSAQPLQKTMQAPDTAIVVKPKLHPRPDILTANTPAGKRFVELENKIMSAATSFTKLVANHKNEISSNSALGKYLKLFDNFLQNDTVYRAIRDNKVNPKTGAECDISERFNNFYRLLTGNHNSTTLWVELGLIIGDFDTFTQLLKELEKGSPLVNELQDCTSKAAQTMAQLPLLLADVKQDVIKQYSQLIKEKPRVSPELTSAYIKLLSQMEELSGRISTYSKIVDSTLGEKTKPSKLTESFQALKATIFSSSNSQSTIRKTLQQKLAAEFTSRAANLEANDMLNMPSPNR